MAWQKHTIRLTIPLILGVPLSLPLVANAINIGDTNVQSQPNQPLNATIQVSDIDPKTFAVSVADGNTYQQFGLSKDLPVVARFIKTSNNSGQIILTTQKPLTTPFTDVVLNIQNQGETKLIPKTLLMPLANSQKVIPQPASQLVEAEPNTVTVNSNNTVSLPTIHNPLPVLNEVPAANTVNPNLVNDPNLRQITENANGIDPNHLVITEVRRYYPVGQTEPTQTVITNAEPIARATTATQTATPDTPTQPTKYVVQRNDNLWTIASQVAKQHNTDVNTAIQSIMAANPATFPNNNPNHLAAKTTLVLPSYEVLHSPSGIKAANALKQHTSTAKKTNLKKSGRTTRLQTKSTTTKNVGKHNQTKRQTAKSTQAVTPNFAKALPNRKTAKPTNNQTLKQKTITPSTKVMQAQRSLPTRKPVLRKTEMKIIAPSKPNGSAQGNPKASGNTPANASGINAQMLAQVQQKRLATAQKATKVNQLNQNLVNAEKRLKLQNAKLAQLEQHLKELNKK